MLKNLTKSQTPRAIHAVKTVETTRTFYVNHAVFADNAYGVYVSNIHNFAVIHSDFYIGSNEAETEPCESEGKSASGYGIYLTGCTGFAIEENFFSKAQGVPQGIYTGILISETQSTDQVYRNTFEGLSYGNYAVGENHEEDDFFQGLAYYCNDNTANYADFYVEQDNNPAKFSGIQSKQGDDDNVAGNKFTPSGATWHFYNGGDYLVGYYFCNYCSNENPDDNKEFQVTDNPKNFDNDCPSHYGGGGEGGTDRGLVLTPDEKQEAEMEFATNLADYDNVKTLYANLKDGGNTEATITDIETAWPDDMWELRSELLDKSPHLSMEVLKATADKTDVCPESVIFEIMAANPDELKKEELITYLEEKENPLPEYMIDILRQVSTGTTYKTVLHRQMAHYNQVKTRAAYDIVRSILNDSIIDNDELRNWLDNIGGKRADEQIIASYLSEGNYNDATALANMMPALYDYSDEEMEEHDYYMDVLNLQISLAQQGKTIHELDSTEVNNLVYIAANSHNTAGAQAKGILEFAYGHHYCNCINADTSGYKSSNIFNSGAFDKMFGVEVKVEPNPVKEWAAFSYTLPDNASEGEIKISDVSGKVINIIPVSGKQGQRFWDTRKIKSGVYFFSLNVSGNNKSGKIIISK